MNFSEDILKYEEKAVFALRQLYKSYGYRQFKMSKFEEYDLYSENKDFLVSDGVITFNDTDGKLLALKPDVTLSIIKNSKESETEVERFYYNENVYRISENSHTYKEIMQTGLECIGNISKSDVCEVAMLACESLKLIDKDFRFNISDISLVNALIEEYSVDTKKVFSALLQKNADILKSVCKREQFEALGVLIKSYKTAKDSLLALEKICKTEKSLNALNDLKDVYSYLSGKGFENNLSIDFSILNSSGYYSGVVFKGYIKGISSRVLSGGRYDKLMKRMGRSSGAVGFAVYLDTLERIEDIEKTDENSYINIALPKGRLGENV